jgi:hypothetical protein
MLTSDAGVLLSMTGKRGVLGMTKKKYPGHRAGIF